MANNLVSGPRVPQKSANYVWDSSVATWIPQTQSAAGGANSTIISVAAFPAGMLSTSAPASGDTGLFVRQVGYVAPSTTVTVAAMPAGSTIVSVAALPAGMLSTAAPASGDTGLFVRQVGFVAYSTTVSVAAMPAGSTSVTVAAVAAGLKINIGSTASENAVTATFLGNYLSSAVTIPSNSTALAVRIAGGVSSGVDFPVTITAGNSSVTLAAVAAGLKMNIGSTAADNAVTATLLAAYLSSAVTIPSNSTALAVRIAGGASSAADFLVRPVFSSTNTDNPVRAVLSSTSADNPVVATIGTNLQSTIAGSSNSSALLVRPIVDNVLTVASTNAFASTSFTIQSSAAAIRTYVTAYSILSPNAGPIKVKFYDGTSMIWPMIFAAVSSAVSGANLAVEAPGYLFRGSAANAMTLQVASSIAGFQVAVSYYRAP